MNGHPKNASLFVKVINSFAAHTNDVLSVAWTGNILASGSADKTIRLWKITKKQEGHMELEEAAFSPVKDHVYHVQCLHFRYVKTVRKFKFSVLNDQRRINLEFVCLTVKRAARYALLTPRNL